MAEKVFRQRKTAVYVDSDDEESIAASKSEL
jgi:hypothetical protein